MHPISLQSSLGYFINNLYTITYKEAITKKNVVIAIALIALALVAAVFIFYVGVRLITRPPFDPTPVLARPPYSPKASPIIGARPIHDPIVRPIDNPVLPRPFVDGILSNEEKEETLTSLRSDTKIEGFYEEDEIDAELEEEWNNIRKLKMSLKQDSAKFEELLSKEYPVYDAAIKLNRGYSKTDKTVAAESIYKALKLREFYGKTHYVFLHNRAFEWKIYSCLIKELMRVMHPNLNYNLTKFLRPPKAKQGVENSAEFLRKFSPINDHESHIRHQLISADAYWLSDAAGESALHFFLDNSSVVSAINPDFIAHACSIVLDACLDPEVFDRQTVMKNYEKRIKQLVVDIREDLKQGLPGELVVICIPKDRINDPNTNPVYRAHSMGVPCTCAIGQSEATLLDSLQKDWRPPAMGCHNVQYRLLASHLLPKNGVKIFGVNPVNKDIKDMYFRRALREMAQEIYTLSLSAKGNEAYVFG